jgi:rfaE bifunctional protein nucleotidyltransferase chain/domain
MDIPKLISLHDLASWRTSRSPSGSWVVTNGCFDLLHVGHVRYLQAARQLGSGLLVGLNDDAGVTALKGPPRPLNTSLDRAEVLAGLACVDAVCIFPGIRATEFLRHARPEIYAKGGDYRPETLDPEEKAVLDAAGSRIEIIPLVPGRSTTALVAKIAPPRP